MMAAPLGVPRGWHITLHHGGLLNNVDALEQQIQFEGWPDKLRKIVMVAAPGDAGIVPPSSAIRK